MALHLHLTGLFADGNDSRLTIDQVRAHFGRATKARAEHLANIPKWRELGHNKELLEACRARATQVKSEQDVENFVVLGIGGSGEFWRGAICCLLERGCSFDLSGF